MFVCRMHNAVQSIEKQYVVNDKSTVDLPSLPQNQKALMTYAPLYVNKPPFFCKYIKYTYMPHSKHAIQNMDYIT